MVLGQQDSHHPAMPGAGTVTLSAAGKTGYTQMGLNFRLFSLKINKCKSLPSGAAVLSLTALEVVCPPTSVFCALCDPMPAGQCWEEPACTLQKTAGKCC